MRILHSALLAAFAVCPGFGGLSTAAAQRPLRPGPCLPVARSTEGWINYSLTGLKLALSLPPDLHPIAFGKLDRLGRKFRDDAVPMTPADSVQLLAAWEAPKKSSGVIRHVLLYSVHPDIVPAGRPCALPIAEQPGVIFRLALGSAGMAADEYRAEAYWPGFVLVAIGTSLDAYDVVYEILKTVVATR